MGSCTSTLNSSVIPGQGTETSTTAEYLGLTHHDIDLLYRYFKKVDMDHTGLVSLNEVIVVNRISSDSLGELVFGLLDRDFDKKLDFYEFVLATWNYLTFDRDTLIEFFFDIYDMSDSGSLSTDEVKHMVGMIWRFRVDGHIKRIFDILDADGNRLMSLDELHDLCKHSEIIMFPAFAMQEILRNSTLGGSRWKELSKFRHNKFGSKSIFEVIDGLDRRKMLQHSLSRLKAKSLGKIDLHLIDLDDSDSRNDPYLFQLPSAEPKHYEFSKASGTPHDPGFPRGYHHHHHRYENRHHSEEKYYDSHKV